MGGDVSDLSIALPVDLWSLCVSGVFFLLLFCFVWWGDGVGEMISGVVRSGGARRKEGRITAHACESETGS